MFNKKAFKVLKIKKRKKLISGDPKSIKLFVDIEFTVPSMVFLLSFYALQHTALEAILRNFVKNSHSQARTYSWNSMNLPQLYIYLAEVNCTSFPFLQHSYTDLHTMDQYNYLVFYLSKPSTLQTVTQSELNLSDWLLVAFTELLPKCPVKAISLCFSSDHSNVESYPDSSLHWSHHIQVTYRNRRWEESM